MYDKKFVQSVTCTCTSDLSGPTPKPLPYSTYYPPMMYYPPTTLLAKSYVEGYLYIYSIHPPSTVGLLPVLETTTAGN